MFLLISSNVWMILVGFVLDHVLDIQKQLVTNCFYGCLHLIYTSWSCVVQSRSVNFWLLMDLMILKS